MIRVYRSTWRQIHATPVAIDANSTPVDLLFLRRGQSAAHGNGRGVGMVGNVLQPPPHALTGTAALFSPSEGPASPGTDGCRLIPPPSAAGEPSGSRNWNALGEALLLQDAGADALVMSEGAWAGLPVGCCAFAAAAAASAAAAEVSDLLAWWHVIQADCMRPGRDATRSQGHCLTSFS